MATVAIAIPAMRPHNLPPVVASIQESTTDYEVVVVATGECAEVAKTLPVTLIADEGGTYPIRINKAFTTTTAPYFMLASDDLHFTPGWFEAVLRVMESQNVAVVATNDLYNHNGVHFCLKRSYIMEFGGYKDAQGIVMFPEMKHQYVDDALRLTARNRNQFAIATEAVTPHHHPGAHKAPMDEVYQLGESSGSHDLALFQSHQELWV